MKKVLFILFLLFHFLSSGAQQQECKVLMQSISGTYSGECRKGLAHGKGIARGRDYYEGQFIKGLPDGTGIYRWAGGIYYEGKLEKGLRHGEGKMVYPDSVVTGIWKEDRYAGKELIPPYEIISSMSVTRYTISKIKAQNYNIKVRIRQGGADNISIEGFTMAYDSGNEFRNGNYYGLENIRFPLSIKIKYRSWNQLMTSQFNVVFEFVINEPGSWDVVINN